MNEDKQALGLPPSGRRSISSTAVQKPLLSRSSATHSNEDGPKKTERDVQPGKRKSFTTDSLAAQGGSNRQSLGGDSLASFLNGLTLPDYDTDECTVNMELSISIAMSMTIEDPIDMEESIPYSITMDVQRET